MKPTIVIGDVHGCLDELQTLWNELSPSAETRIVFLGDLIDRGPDSAGVVEFVRTKSQQHPLILLRGNHEAKAIKCFERGLSSPVGLQEEHIQFLATGLPFYPFDDCPYLAVHAGIFPAFWEHYPTLPNLSEQANWEKKLRNRVDRFLYCRYVNPAGNVVALGQEQPCDHFWAESYDGRAGLAFFGHQPFMEGPVRFKHAMGLDTGCTFGGKLSAAVLNEQGDIALVSVPSQKPYAQLYEIE